ncbi:hypothetical protein PCASD_22427 [Puccinia coronata f. sp. avenae]|uniref:Uncharacterized protein n=1 Tax=Puccinia coronata f. sp. avenae TaxID=200324 RepID=A0A2N5SBA9_9BASI|nr:hypothetical protein PCASD_22427 [Puccinia coronata f. sp. avenae]
MPHKRAKASIRKAESLRKGFDLPPNQHANRKKKRKEKHSSSERTYQISEDIPKNMFRILNAEKIRAEYKIRKTGNNAPLATTKPSSSSTQNTRSKLESSRESTASTNKRRKKSTQSSKAEDDLKILPGEGLGSFNRRVEATLRPKVTAVMKAAKNKSAPQKVVSSQGASSSTPAEAENEVTMDNSADQELPSVKAKPVKDFAPRPSKFPITDVVMEPPTLSLTKTMKKNLSANRTPLPISSAQKRSLELERDKVIKHYRQMKEERHALQT